jgi:hypothetical protein
MGVISRIEVGSKATVVQRGFAMPGHFSALKFGTAVGSANAVLGAARAAGFAEAAIRLAGLHACLVCWVELAQRLSAFDGATMEMPMGHEDDADRLLGRFARRLHSAISR